MGVSRSPDIDKETPIAGGSDVEGKPARRERGRRTARNKTLRQLLEGLRALDNGDFRTRLTPNGDPLMAKVTAIGEGSKDSERARKAVCAFDSKERLHDSSFHLRKLSWR